MISTVIFDLDGLLADTEGLHRQAYRDVLGNYGVTVTDQEYEEHWIRQGKGITEFLLERNLALDPDTIRRNKSERYNELVRCSVRPMPGALELLAQLRSRKSLALASSSYPEAVAAVVAALGIAACFQVIVSRGDVARVKPAPDLFLLAAAKLGVTPAQCVVLEDAEKGIKAAVAAGMKCIAVPNEHTFNNDFSGATLVAGSLLEITPEVIDGLS